jgi:hypothetical protein
MSRRQCAESFEDGDVHGLSFHVVSPPERKEPGRVSNPVPAIFPLMNSCKFYMLTIALIREQ